MEGGQLHRLGRRLIELSRQATAEPGDLALTPGQEAVLTDVITHPDGSVSEICERTGFAQSHVSASVAWLKEHELVTTSTDPADRRRTRVHVTDAAMGAIVRRAGRSTADAVRLAVGDPRKAKRANALLDELAELLLP